MIRSSDPTLPALTIAHSAIVQAMSSAGISKSELARRMGVTPQVVSRMLSSRYNNMTLRTLARAVSACGYRLQITIERTGSDAKSTDAAAARIVSARG